MRQGIEKLDQSRLDDYVLPSQESVITPKELKRQLPLRRQALKSVQESRLTIKRILDREDHRLIVVVGPCSIHDADEAVAYARQLKDLAHEVDDTLCLVMRVYFEKPRTSVGWKGLINDPFMDNSCDIRSGLNMGRKLMLKLAGMDIAIATEALDPVTPLYLHDVVTWSAIGARTTESQTHRELASGLTSAVGFKNGTDGNLDVAINALHSALTPHRYLGINHTGEVALIRTGGNRHAHIVLRGGTDGTNYQADSVTECESRLREAAVPVNIMIDCSHANSDKVYARQPLVAEEVAAQINNGNRSIVGLMLESNINEGAQKLCADRAKLAFGVSVTDPCIDFETTAKCILELRESVRDSLRARLDG